MRRVGRARKRMEPLIGGNGERVEVEMPMLVYVEVKARALKGDRVRITITGPRDVAFRQLAPDIRKDAASLLGCPPRRTR